MGLEGRDPPMRSRVRGSYGTAHTDLHAMPCIALPCSREKDHLHTYWKSLVDDVLDFENFVVRGASPHQPKAK